ncbi:MAG: ABC transporter permease [Eubacterium sp.]|nr:ABC transporter permease [Eubacterium sp.]
MLWISTLREIKGSLGRYIAIMLIVALGVGFFSGLKVTKEDMITTGSDYVDESKMYDFIAMSSLGFDDESVGIIEKAPDVRLAEGSISKDILVRTESGADEVVKFMSMTEEVNKLELKYGRLPEKPDECVVDIDKIASSLGTDEIKEGDMIVLSEDNDEDDLEMFRYDRYKVVGAVTSPLYMNFERGSSELGAGTVSSFAVIPEEGFDSDAYTEVYVKLDSGAAAYSDEYEEACDRAEDGVKKAAKQASKSRYDSIVGEAMEKLEKQKKKYQKNVDKYERKKKKAYDKLASALKEIEDGEKKLDQGEKKLKTGKKQIRKNEKLLKKNEKRIKKSEKVLRKNEKKLKAGRKKLEAGQKELNKGKKELAAQKRALEAQKEYMPEEQYRQAMAQIEAGEKELAGKQKELDKGFAEIRKGEKELAAGKKKLAAGKSSLAAGKKKLAAGKARLRKSEKELKDGRKKLADARIEYRKGEEEADEKFADAEKKLEDGKEKLEKAEKKINRIKRGKTYVYGREINIGYSTFESNAGIVESIAKVFPLFFFLIAALVCMTTMTRMIDEQRTQIGVLKALGYSDTAVLGKYMFYSGSAALIGAVSGFFIGCKVFPEVIWHAYGMMLNIADRPLAYIVDVPLLLISLVTALICSMGATWMSCAQDFTVAPAQLIRPKAPKSGKRILLERIPAIWNRLKFLYKVSLRNIFRYKGRFLMMVIGISGCTALLIAAFGISTTVKNVAEFQYTEIEKYDFSVSFDCDMTEKKQEDFHEYAGEHARDMLFVHRAGSDVICGKSTVTAYLIASDGTSFSDFIDLHDGQDKTEFPGSGEAVVCRKFRDHYRVKTGDVITVKEGSIQAEFRVSGFCDNYVNNYVYVSSSAYEEAFGEEAAVKTALVKDPEDDDMIREDAAYCARYKNAGTVSVNADMLDRVRDMMVSLDAVILAVILSAALLAFIVLYDLTNINITERIREIATIKVLGFYAGETSAYVFRENFFLTGISALVGIPLGKVFLDFVVSNIIVDTIFFVARITIMDYVKSVLLTFLFAILVALIMYRRLDRVSMTESLKSVE